jgi:hypothetical protein
MTRARTCFEGLILILVLVLAQPARAFQNEPNDCRGIKWGTEYHELKGFTRVSTQSPLDYYRKEDEEMTLGDARLEMVVYVFFEKKLCGAVLNFKSSPNFQIIKTALFDRYGKGHQPNRYKDQYRWSGTKVAITLEYDDVTQKGKVMYYYVPIYGKIQRLDQRRTR